MSQTERVVCIGAGPAGLTASYLLTREGVPVTVLEADPSYVGGISRTIEYKGFRFDIGGHRFFSKSEEVERLWTELLPNDMLERPRSSRIYYRGRFFSYPLKPFEALSKLGLIESCLCVLSYMKAALFPKKNPANFEDWVSNQFGKRLFRIFFKTYTEKVWGMSCTEISADWAAQRIKGLSLASAIFNAIRPRKKSADRSQDRSKTIKTLIDSFRYPRLGPGMMWEAAAAKTREQGGEIVPGARVTGLSYSAEAKTWTVSYEKAGVSHAIAARHVISSAPMRELMRALSPAPQSLPSAEKLRYRDFLVVALILHDRQLFDDNWIYIHEPNVKVGRIQNFKSWSPEMVPDAKLCCYGMEYFCFEGDGLWSSSDAALIEMAKSELAKLGLCESGEAVDGCVIRQPKAYPVYDDEYKSNVEKIRAELASRYPNLHLAGRNGMHKYNNQDHAMMTATLVARNIVAGEQLYDPWKVNEDAEYHEAGSRPSDTSSSGLRLVPERLSV